MNLYTLHIEMATRHDWPRECLGCEHHGEDECPLDWMECAHYKAIIDAECDEV